MSGSTILVCLRMVLPYCKWLNLSVYLTCVILWHIMHIQFGKSCIKGIFDSLHGTYSYSIQFLKHAINTVDVRWDGMGLPWGYDYLRRDCGMLWPPICTHSMGERRSAPSVWVNVDLHPGDSYAMVGISRSTCNELMCLLCYAMLMIIHAYHENIFFLPFT